MKDPAAKRVELIMARIAHEELMQHRANPARPIVTIPQKKPEHKPEQK